MLQIPFFFPGGEKDLSLSQEKQPYEYSAPCYVVCSFASMLHYILPEVMATTYQDGAQSTYPAALSGMHSCTKRERQSLTKPSAEQSLNMLSSLQNQFVYCYRMQDKDLKSTLVLSSTKTT